jgi:ribosomal protein S18 acetylase RimI-like enzyme
MAGLDFRSAQESDLDRCHEIEHRSYEGDAGATKEKIAKRIREHPDGFIVAELDGKVIGFINSGCAHEVVMSDDDFKELIGHDPQAPNVVIMSVVIDQKHQGKGYSKELMQKFVERCRSQGKETIHLMCKERHVPLYAKMGYQYTRLSRSSYAGISWHEMMIVL